MSARALARADDARRATRARGAASNAMDKTRGETTTTTTTTRRSGGRRRDARARASADDVEERVIRRRVRPRRGGSGMERRRDETRSWRRRARRRCERREQTRRMTTRDGCSSRGSRCCFKPFIGRGTRATVKRTIVPGQMWAFEQKHRARAARDDDSMRDVQAERRIAVGARAVGADGGVF